MAHDTEQWRWVPGYEGRYEASDQGRVRSYQPWRGTPVPRLLTPVVQRFGYHKLAMSGPGPYGDRPTLAHRVVMDTFVGPRPDGLVTRHLDGNPSNNSLSNLAYGSMQENSDDTKQHGRNYALNRTHCPQGHAYVIGNIYQNGVHRNCKTCALARAAAFNRAKRAAVRGDVG